MRISANVRQNARWCIKQTFSKQLIGPSSPDPDSYRDGIVRMTSALNQRSIVSYWCRRHHMLVENGYETNLPTPEGSHISLFNHLLHHHLSIVPYLDDVNTDRKVAYVDWGLRFSNGLGDELLAIGVGNGQGCVFWWLSWEFDGYLDGWGVGVD